jgi:perosamine synthetase
MREGLTMDRIPVVEPSITQREIGYVTDAVTNAWYGNANMYHARFENAFAMYLGRKDAIALSSTISNIHLSLLALSVGFGDEVIIPDSTWITSAAPIDSVGATPEFVDVHEATWCIRPDTFEAAITYRTKAVILVDLYGSMPAMDRLLAIASARVIAVIEDAAEAVDSEHCGRLAGGFGDTSVFSFHVTDRRNLYDRAQYLRDHGSVPGDVQFFNAEVAYKYKMSRMQAAPRTPATQRERDIFAMYRDTFVDVHGSTLNAEPAGTKNSYWMITAVWDRGFSKSKNDIVMVMRDGDVDVRPFFHPLSSLPSYAGVPGAEIAVPRNVISYDIGSRAVNLPSGFSLSAKDVGKVCTSLRRLLDSQSR